MSAGDETAPDAARGPDDVRTDRLPEPGEQLYQDVWDKGRQAQAIYECIDERFPEGSTIQVEDNRDGRAIQVVGPDQETLGVWWSNPAPVGDLIYRGP